jgi:hypothetical protein
MIDFPHVKAELPSWFSDESLLVVIDCAIDESGAKDSKHGNILIVSACVGSTSQMRKLSKGWQSALGELPYFHAKDLWKKQSKLFRGMSMNKRDRLLTDLVEMVHKRTEWGFSASINVEFYNDRTSQRFRSQWGSAYTFAMRMVVISLILVLEREKRAREPINFLIEHGHVNSGQAVEMLADFEGFDDKPLIINSRGTAPRDGNPSLQAADMLAFATWEKLRDNRSRIMDKLIAKPKKPLHFFWDCNTDLVDIMKDTVESYFSRKKSAWETARKERECLQ